VAFFYDSLAISRAFEAPREQAQRRDIPVTIRETRERSPSSRAIAPAHVA
jgi:hypothetical protein